MWVSLPSEAKQKFWNSKEIVINCSINNNFSHHYKKKKKNTHTHILMKKSTKNTFPGKKHHSEKSTKTLWFIKNIRWEDCIIDTPWGGVLCKDLIKLIVSSRMIIFFASCMAFNWRDIYVGSKLLNLEKFQVLLAKAK